MISLVYIWLIRDLKTIFTTLDKQWEVRAQARLLLGRLEVIGPGAAAAAGRRNYALNLERIWANQRRADALSRLQGKALLRRGQFKID